MKYYIELRTEISCRSLRHCAISRKINSSIPDDVIGIFHWHNPSSRTMALGSTQPITEMSTRKISWGGGSPPVRRADNLTTFMCRMSWNLRASTSWNPQGLSRPVMGLLYLLKAASEFVIMRWVYDLKWQAFDHCVPIIFTYIHCLLNKWTNKYKTDLVDIKKQEIIVPKPLHWTVLHHANNYSFLPHKYICLLEPYVGIWWLDETSYWSELIGQTRKKTSNLITKHFSRQSHVCFICWPEPQFPRLSCNAMTNCFAVFRYKLIGKKFQKNAWLADNQNRQWVIGQNRKKNVPTETIYWIDGSLRGLL